MFKALLGCWPLYLGLAIIGLSMGAQHSLLGVRATLEGFDSLSTGLLMSGYYIGNFSGALLVPRLIKAVGHIRTFGALASLASIAILAHAAFVDPTAWTLMRFTTGFSFIGIFLVAESWINAEATNLNRGTMLSLYSFSVFGGAAAGQFLLELADPTGFELFALISVLISFALIPMLSSPIKSPSYSRPVKINLRELFPLAPLGVVGCTLAICMQSMIFGMGAVYATSAGLTLREVALFMSTFVFSGVVTLYPMGRISDRIDRRIMILICSAGSATCAVLGLLNGGNTSAALFLIAAALGSFSIPIYSLCAAHTNDQLSSEQAVGTAATLLFIGGIGSIAGPLVSAASMKILGNHGFFFSLLFPSVSIALLAFWRILQPTSAKVRTQGEQSPAPTACNHPLPDSGHALITDKDIASEHLEEVACIQGENTCIETS